MNLTQTEVFACLNPCTNNCTILVTANISLDETIDLSAYPNLTFELAGTSTLTLNGGNDLILSATSTLLITSTATNALKTNQPDPEPVIIIGSTTYTEADFPSIINAGGANVSGVLPIELLSFSARQVDSYVLIEWATATEINNDYMVVEHSTDGRKFSEAGRIAGAGNSSEMHYYSFQHKYPVARTNYYRLKQVDFDGKVAYHEVVPVVFEGDAVSVTTFPNPAHEQLTLHLNGWENDQFNLEILDMAGRILQRHSPAETGNVNLDLKNLSSGIYFIRIQSNERVELIRFKKE